MSNVLCILSSKVTRTFGYDLPVSRSRSRSSESHATMSVLSRSALPRTDLPRLSGNCQTWRTFRDLFTSLIRNNVDLSNVEKMHYLWTCITDEAACLTSNLSLSGDHVALAWQMLCSRYDNKRNWIVFSIWSHLRRNQLKVSEQYWLLWLKCLGPYKPSIAQYVIGIFFCCIRLLNYLYWDPGSMGGQA